MKHRLPIIIFITLIAATTIVVLTVPVLPHSQPFNLSRDLPTGTSSFNGQLGCGSNQTVPVVFPANGVVSFRITQNETGATVDIWMTSDTGGVYSFLNTGGGGGGEYGRFSSGDGRFTFVFQACGPTPTVVLGFWGETNYSAPLL